MNRPVHSSLDGVFTVEVDQARYDELLHKEALLDGIKTLHNRLSEYVFRDAVGHLLKTDTAVETDDE